MNLSWIKKIYNSIKTDLNSFFYFFKKNKLSIKNKIKKQDKKLIDKLITKKIPNFKQLKYLPKFLSDKEKKQIKILSFISLISISFFIISYTWRHMESIPKIGGTYSEAVIGGPQYINPILATTNNTDLDLIRLIYSGLLKYDNNLELEPDLAESYKISPDQKIYTFKLKKNLFWHDNKPLKIDDIIFTIKTIQNKNSSSPLEPIWRDIKIKQLNDYTIQFSLEKPLTNFLENLTLGIIPKHIWQTIPPQNIKLAKINLKPIGSGAWKFDNLKKDKQGNIISYTLKSFDKYYNQTPYLKNIEFKIYPDIESAKQALLEKNVDGMSYITKEKKTDLKLKKNINIYNLQLPQYTAIFINDKKNSILKDIDIKKALKSSLSKKRIILEVYNGEAEEISSPILSDISGFNYHNKPDIYNQQQANEFLDKAGWKYENNKKFRHKNNKELELTLTTVDLEENIKTAEIIRQAWKNIGIKVNLNIIPVNIIQSEIIKPRNYELLLFGEVLGPNHDLYPFWHSSQRQDPGLNLTNFNNKKADYLLEQIKQNFDTEKANIQIKELAEIISKEIPAIFLFQPTYSYPLLKHIKGFSMQRINTPSDRLIDINNRYIKTTKKLKLNN